MRVALKQCKDNIGDIEPFEQPAWDTWLLSADKESEKPFVRCHIILQATMSYCPVTTEMLMTAASGKNFSVSIHVILRFVRSLKNFIQIKSNHDIRKNERNSEENKQSFLFLNENKKWDHDFLRETDDHFCQNSLQLFLCDPCCMGNLKMLFGVATNIFHVKTIRCRFAGILSEYLSISVS